MSYTKSYTIGILCPPFKGHLNPMLSLAQKLLERGHKIVLFYYTTENLDAEFLRDLGINLVRIASENQKEDIDACLHVLSSLSGWKANKQTIDTYNILTTVNLYNLSSKVLESECQMLLVDQSILEGETIAHEANVPFITICNAIILNPDIEVPPPFVCWQPNNSLISKLRNLIGYIAIGIINGVPLRSIQKYRKHHNLPPYSPRFKEFEKAIWSPIATITQQPACFEFKREKLPDNFHFSAPFINSKVRSNIEFCWEEIGDKPLVYASIGTLQHSVNDIYDKIIAACDNLNCQLVLSLGKKGKSNSYTRISRDVLLVDFAPQLELLKKSTLCITHAGLNTTLEALSNGVPMIAIPIANDQPGIAARIEWAGTGKVVNRNCSVLELKSAICEVMYNKYDQYKKNALLIQEEILKTNGLHKSANLIENYCTKYI